MSKAKDVEVGPELRRKELHHPARDDVDLALIELDHILGFQAIVLRHRSHPWSVVQEQNSTSSILDLPMRADRKQDSPLHAYPSREDGLPFWVAGSVEGCDHEKEDAGGIEVSVNASTLIRDHLIGTASVGLPGRHDMREVK